jgi:hypothetical protein
MGRDTFPIKVLGSVVVVVAVASAVGAYALFIRSAPTESKGSTRQQATVVEGAVAVPAQGATK